MLAPAVEDVGLAAEARDLCLGLRHLLGELLDLRLELVARIPALCHQALGEVVAVELGEPIGKLGGELGILGAELDHDAARVLDLMDAQGIVVSGEHPLLVALAGARSDQPHQVQQLAEQVALDQAAVELGLLGQMQLGCEFQCEIARQQRAHVRGDRFLVHAHRHDVGRCRCRGAARTGC